MGRKERFYLLFVLHVYGITGTPFCAASTVVVAKDRLKPSLPCLAGGEEAAGRQCQLRSSFLQQGRESLVYHT